MNVTIEDGCIACGACEATCSEVFKVEDVATADNSKVAGNEDAVKEAANSCPVSVISVN